MTNIENRLVLGVLVNPFAGVGGAVGLKGSDGSDTREEALRRGATPMAVDRMTRALAGLAARTTRLEVLTWGGAMGEDSCRAAGLPARSLGEPPSPSEADDTRRAARALVDAGAQLLLFAGGVGTAR
ncbi:MAG: ATP-NAD kinase, partial [Alloalcanivorax venustensis]